MPPSKRLRIALALGLVCAALIPLVPLAAAAIFPPPPADRADDLFGGLLSLLDILAAGARGFATLLAIGGALSGAWIATACAWVFARRDGVASRGWPWVPGLMASLATFLTLLLSD